MICEQCQQEDKTSEIDVGTGAVSTAMAVRYFYDTEGRYHAHDPNWVTITFRCSNGHEWAETSQDKCWCEREVKL